jgi:hypothetical protein
MKTILETGQLGIAIMQELLCKNPHEQILMINRSGKMTLPIPPNVEVKAADLS